MNLPNQIVWSPGVSIETMIQQAIEAAMVFYRGNKTAAAQSLGIAIRTLDTRLEKYKKEKEQHEERVAEARERRAEFQARQRAVPQGAGFDTSATPSIHAVEVERRRKAAAGGDAPASHAAGTGVQPKPVARVASK